MRKQNQLLVFLIIVGCFALLAIGGIGFWWFRYTQRSRIYETQARADYKRKDYQSTIDDCKKWITYNDRARTAYELRAGAYYHIKAYDDAILDTTRAIELSRTYKHLSSLHTNRGLYHLLQEQWDFALWDFDKAIFYDAQHWNAYQQRGKTYLKMGRYTEALRDCNRAIAIKNDSVSCYITRSAVYDAMGQTTNALADCRKALDLNRYSAAAWTDWGWAQYRTGNYTASIESSRRAVELDSSQQTARFNIALCFAMQNKAAESCQAYREAISKGSDERRGAAWKELQEALEKHPDIPALQQAAHFFQTGDQPKNAAKNT